jgi:hypothetical protein
MTRVRFTLDLHQYGKADLSEILCKLHRSKILHRVGFDDNLLRL